MFYNQMLRGLGFRAYTVGVRIRHRVDGIPAGEYIGWYVFGPPMRKLCCL